ncbi:baseplate J/gp47 family protein [Sorangium sp. So ce1335]|uniref:baseplate J/gp47 family protein n=1 Tax=Sorangium sp. So ce1335 TaxID=3133335 RepID=UPI003F6453DD
MTTPWLRWADRQASSLFQGIDYLELVLVPDEEAPTSARLIVHLKESWGAPQFSEKSFAISGGLRITSLGIAYAGENGADRTVELDLSAVGDASEYTLTLLSGGGLPVHPFFASATFVFTLSCERGDCRPLAEEPPRALRPRPAVDLLTKDYAGFVQMFGDWARVKNPAWADLSPASLERVLVELLAHHGDLLSYYQDRVANEAFIDTASQRYSLRQHAALLGTGLFDGTAAETLLCFRSSSDGYLPAAVEVTTPAGAGGAEVVFWLTERTRILAHHSELALAAWPGAEDAIVPALANEVLLWGAVENLLVGQRLALVQGDAFGAAAPDEPLPPAQIVTITAFRHERLPGWTASPADAPHADDADVTVVTFDPPLSTAMRPAWGKPDALRIHGNLGRARFGRSRQDRYRRSETTFARDRQSYVLERRRGSSHLLLRALRLSQAPVVFEASTTAAGLTVSSVRLELSIGSERWQRVEHLHASQSFDRHFVTSADEDGSLWIEFGDGKQGRAVEVWSEAALREAKEKDEQIPGDIVVGYRTGDPVAGNVGAGVLTRFVPGQIAVNDFTGLRVVNVLPGTGGLRPETRDAARLRIPASLRHGPTERAVSLADYADAAMTVEGVGRATAKLLGGPFNAVLVLVDPEGQAELSEGLRRAVHDRIDALRMTGREHFVSAAEYVPIDVRLGICVEPGSLPHRVRAAVLAALRPGSSAHPGFFHPDRLSFSEALELGDLLAFVQRLPGVRSVKALRFRKLKVPSDKDVEPRITLAPTEVVRNDGDDDRPDNGKLKVLVVGLDAGLTEKDFVIEEVAP